MDDGHADGFSEKVMPSPLEDVLNPDEVSFRKTRTVEGKFKLNNRQSIMERLVMIQINAVNMK